MNVRPQEQVFQIVADVEFRLVGLKKQRDDLYAAGLCDLAAQVHEHTALLELALEEGLLTR